MKKLILLLILTSTITFGKWEAVYRRDEFFDLTETLDFLRHMPSSKDPVRLFYGPYREHYEEYLKKVSPIFSHQFTIQLIDYEFLEKGESAYFNNIEYTKYTKDNIKYKTDKNEIGEIEFESGTFPYLGIPIKGDQEKLIQLMKDNNFLKLLIKTKNHGNLIYYVDCKGFTKLYNFYGIKKEKNELYQLLEDKNGYFK